MDKYRVKINPKAIRELDSIYQYIATEKQAPENAKGQVDRIKKAILSLDTFPQSHQERNEGRYAVKSIDSCSSITILPFFESTKPKKRFML